MNKSSVKHKLHEQTPFVIWLFKDGKQEHENQTDGLVAALNKRAFNRVHTVSIEESFFLALLKFKLVLPWRVRGFSKPNLIIGTGRKTHLWMLLARLFYGGKVIVLMKPNLPTYLFDLVCVPTYEKLGNKRNIIRTQGALNAGHFAQDSVLNRGLIFIGAPSKHYYWNHESVFKQIRHLVEVNPDILWEISTSSRTPRETVDALSELNLSNMQYTSFEDRDKYWLSGRLKIASRVWVTQDNLSMIYEGITAGSEVGVIRLKGKKQSSPIAQSIQQLIQDSLILTQSELDVNRLKSVPHFNEAEYCADEVFTRFS